MFDLKAKKALVTGGSRGIGRATALALAAQGAQVALTYSTNAGAAEEVVGQIEAAGGAAQAHQLDVADFDAAEAGVRRLATDLGGLDILVANAGISIDALLLRLKRADLESTLNVNVLGAVACARAALRPMMRARQGRIIFVSSVVGQMGSAGQVAYAASKAALVGITKSLAREYAARGVTVNALAPGYVETDMTNALEPAQREAMLSAVPAGRPARPEEMAAAVCFLASDESAYITGQVLASNGGMYM